MKSIKVVLGNYTYVAGVLCGDVNNDGQVNIPDVMALVNIILGKDNVEPYQYNHVAADVNGDTVVSLSDVTLLVNTVLSGQ